MSKEEFMPSLGTTEGDVNEQCEKRKEGVTLWKCRNCGKVLGLVSGRQVEICLKGQYQYYATLPALARCQRCKRLVKLDDTSGDENGGILCIA